MMAIGVIKNETKVGIVEEAVEGTEDPISAGAEFIQVLEGIEVAPAKELLERLIIASGKGKVQPRVSTKSVSGSTPVEWKGSGVEGQAPETDVLWQALLGGKNQLVARITTGTTHTTSLINAVAHGLVVGDFVVILEAGDHTAHFVESKTDDTFTYTPARSGAPSDAVEIAKSTTYYAAGDEPTYTKHVYWGDEIHEGAIGLRPASGSFENLTTGQIPTITFAEEGTDYNEVNEGSSATGQTPAFDDEIPPVALCVTLTKDGVALEMDELSLSVENTISFLTSVTSCTGRLSSRIAERLVNGSLAPYMDDNSLDLWNDFNDNTSFSLVCIFRNESTTTGEFDLGSVVGFYLPQCIFTSLTKADKDGVLTRPAEFQANTGTTGDLTEIFVGFC